MSCGDPMPYSGGLIGRTAWECPRCHKINAPHVDWCACKPEGDVESKKAKPRWTFEENPTIVPLSKLGI